MHHQKYLNSKGCINELDYQTKRMKGKEWARKARRNSRWSFSVLNV